MLCFVFNLQNGEKRKEENYVKLVKKVLPYAPSPGWQDHSHHLSPHTLTHPPDLILIHVQTQTISICWIISPCKGTDAAGASKRSQSKRQALGTVLLVGGVGSGSCGETVKAFVVLY